MAFTVVGNVLEATCFEWRIPDFFKLLADKSQLFFNSPVFPFSGCTYYLQLLYLGDNQADGCVSLFWRKERLDGVVKIVTCTLGIKKSDGTLQEQESNRKTFEENCFGVRYDDFLRIEDLQKRKSELVPSNALTITCRMEKDNVPSGQPVEVDTGSSKLTELETLSNDFSDLFVSKRKCDVTIQVKDKDFQTHKAILVARCPVFAAMFEHGTSEEETGVVTVPDCDPDSFGDFLQYLYTGKLEDPSFRNALHLYVTADKYGMQELRSFCVACLKRNMTTENVCDVVTLADQYDETGLLSSAQTFFNENFGKIISTAEWRRLMKKKDCLLANRLLEGMAPNIEIKK